MKCRHCARLLEHVFLDLGNAPPSNAYLTRERLDAPELTYPLQLYVCDTCWLVQTKDFLRPDVLFDTEYAYFSSTSTTWLDHARRFCDMAISRFGLGPRSFVLEVASNDGYLLQHFVNARIPCMGFEPTASTAAVAEARGIPVVREFFGRSPGERLAHEGRLAQLIIANNVYAHVPDINDFTDGLKAALAPGGTISVEFPHLLRMVAETQFDTAYHEHFSYLSLHTTRRVFERAGLRVFDVQELSTHGGSLRVYGCHLEDPRMTEASVDTVLASEEQAGLRRLSTYTSFQSRASRIKDDLLLFLIDQKRAGLRVAAYGAAAKGNTLLNYAGVKSDLLAYVCDAAPSKQRRYLPGSRIPILPPSALLERRPDIVLILPWNIADEIISEHQTVREWGGRFAVAIPHMELRDA